MTYLSNRVRFAAWLEREELTLFLVCAPERVLWCDEIAADLAANPKPHEFPAERRAEMAFRQRALTRWQERDRG